MFEKHIGAFSGKILPANMYSITGNGIYFCKHLVFPDFGLVGLDIFAVDPVENAEDSSVETRKESSFCGLYNGADKVDAFAAKKIHDAKAACVNVLMVGKIDQLYKVAFSRRIEPPGFPIKTAFGGSYCNSSEAVFFTQKTFQIFFIGFGAFRLVMHTIPPSAVAGRTRTAAFLLAHYIMEMRFLQRAAKLRMKSGGTGPRKKHSGLTARAALGYTKIT